MLWILSMTWWITMGLSCCVVLMHPSPPYRGWRMCRSCIYQEQLWNKLKGVYLESKIVGGETLKSQQSRLSPSRVGVVAVASSGHLLPWDMFAGLWQYVWCFYNQLILETPLPWEHICERVMDRSSPIQRTLLGHSQRPHSGGLVHTIHVPGLYP